MRAVPELVLILLLYYAGTDLINRALQAASAIEPSTSTALLAGMLMLGFVQGAYSTEVLRGAILGIPQGQIEAGRAFGMSPVLLMRRISLPAMLPFAIPGLANLWLSRPRTPRFWPSSAFDELTLLDPPGGRRHQGLYDLLPRGRRALSAALPGLELHLRPHRTMGAARHAVDREAR